MSFYNTANPLRFSTNNPNVNQVQNVSFLKSGFQQPSADNSLSDLTGTDLTYTAEQVINRYIVRSDIDGPSIDQFPTAADLVEALNKNQWVRATAQDSKAITIQNSFYFDLTIVNQDANNTITLSGASGITIGLSGSVAIGPGQAIVLRVQVLNASETSPVIYVNILTTETTPSGVIHPYGGTTVPAGYLLCNGQAVSRELYSTLFSVIGETFGAGDSLLTFNVPDLRGRIPVGQTGASSYFQTLGGSGGQTDVTLTIPQIPAHSHTGTTDSAGSHTHTLNNATTVQKTGNNTPDGLDSSANEIDCVSTLSASVNSNGAHTHDFTSTNTGGGQSHTNVQPYVTVNYIIKY